MIHAKITKIYSNLSRYFQNAAGSFFPDMVYILLPVPYVTLQLSQFAWRILADGQLDSNCSTVSTGHNRQCFTAMCPRAT